MARAWLTPDDLPTTTLCKMIELPAGVPYEAAVRGALLSLCEPQNWEKWGELDAVVVAAIFADLIIPSLSNWEDCPE